MLGALENASKVEITEGFNIIENLPEKRSRLKKILIASWDEKNIDSRIFALSWIETRMRINPEVGDQGKACGIFQIHARYSYPMFRRKYGFRNWDESENKKQINYECNKLKKVNYSINTLSKYLNLFDKRNLHVCHHNSGIYGKCNIWYKKRVEFFVKYFDFHKMSCSTNLNPLTVNEFNQLRKTKEFIEEKISSF